MALILDRGGCVEDILCTYGHFLSLPLASIPYVRQHHRSRGRGCDVHKSRVNVCRDPQLRDREMKMDTRDGTRQSWFKVTVSVLAESTLARVFWNLTEGRLH